MRIIDISVKQASLTKVLPVISRMFRGAAQVPKGEAFAPTLGIGIKRVARLGLDPYLGRHGQIPKRLLQGAALWTAGTGFVQGREQIQNSAQQALAVVPSVPRAQPLRSWLQDLKTSPVWTSARTAVMGLPKTVPQEQRDLVQHALKLKLRQTVHQSGSGSSWQDMLQTVYRPADPAIRSGLSGLLQYFVPKPGLRDYADVGSSAYRTFKNLKQPAP